MTLAYFFMITLWMGLSQADRILINSPQKHATFQPGDELSVDYTVRFEGMAKLGSTSVSLHYANHTVLTFLPGAGWTDTPTGERGANTSWTIPNDLDRGKYLLRISGPATYLCSSTGNGQAPYDRCQMTIHKTRHFQVGTEDQADQDAEEALQEQVEKLQELQMQVQQIQEEQAQQIQEEQAQQIQEQEQLIQEQQAQQIQEQDQQIQEQQEEQEQQIQQNDNPEETSPVQEL